MARVMKRKMKLAGSKDDNDDLSEMFNQMIGAGGVNLAIAYPRYRTCDDIVKLVVRVFQAIAGCTFMSQPLMASTKEEIASWCANAESSRVELFKADLEAYSWDWSAVPDDTRKQFGEVYNAAKQSELLAMIVRIRHALHPYRADLTHEPPKDTFIMRMAGAEFRPFPFTGLNLKQVFMGCSDTSNEGIRKFFTLALGKIYAASEQIYSALVSPDIDVDKFVDVIVSSLEKLQKMPELSRCGLAFSKIRKSVSMLKERFNDYYRDFIQSGDSTIIMQNFILDVSGDNTSADPKTISQFRKIIMFYRKQAAQHANNPQLKKMFDMANKAYENIERGRPKSVPENPDELLDEPIASAEVAEPTSDVVAEPAEPTEPSEPTPTDTN